MKNVCGWALEDNRLFLLKYFLIMKNTDHLFICVFFTFPFFIFFVLLIQFLDYNKDQDFFDCIKFLV